MKMTRSPYFGHLFNVSRTMQIIEYDDYKYNLNHLPIREYHSKALTWVLVLSVSLCVVCIILLIKTPSILLEAMNELSEEDKSRCNKLMQNEQTENRYFVRIMIVGKESAGKTCVMRRLLKENISGVSSTDGVDIVVRRCKINVEDGEWIIDKEIDDDKVDRIKRALKPTDKTKNATVAEENRERSFVKFGKFKSTNSVAQDQVSKIDNNVSPEKTTNGEKTETSEISVDTTKKSHLTHSEKLHIKENVDENIVNNEPTLLVMPEDLMSHVFTYSATNKPLNLYALCELWDFAGQKEFYATHQAFLTSNAVYLVVADMNDDISKQGSSQCFADFRNVGEYVDFWFDSIHCHRTVYNSENEYFDPPILLVFTRKDKCDKACVEERIQELDKQLENVFTDQSKKHHLHEKFYLSNTQDSDDEFKRLRNAIFSSASQMNDWGQDLPLKWILLEHLIEINKEEGKKNFIKFTDMVKMAKHPDINILEEKDLLRFLRFQHSVGNIIFFENIPDLIILNPQWLADAFRCLVSDRVDTKLHHLDDWTLLKQSGKISESLITKLFESKPGSQFSGQRGNLHKIMEKFDILVKIENSSLYIMPSKMPTSTFEDVCQNVGIRKDDCKRTSWLCLKFDFLPPSFFNHITAWFIRNYNPSTLDSDRGSFALYRGICVFDIDESGCVKILVTMSTDTIALQVVSFSKHQKKMDYTCDNIYNKVKQVVKEVKESYKVKISYKLHFKCSDGDYYKDTFKYETLASQQEYYCPQHKTAHQSDLIYSPWMNNEIEKIPDDREKISTSPDELSSKNEPINEEIFTQDQASVKNNLPVSVTLRKQINIEMQKNESQFITSCIKTGNTLVFTDYNDNRLINCNSDGTNKHHMSLSYAPQYITEIDSNTVAVSCGVYNTILIINISTRSVTSTINTSGYCDGISYNDNNLYVVIDRRLIHVMDLTGKVIRTITVPLDNIWDITVDRDRLVCIDDTSIYCCSLEGKVMWKFKKDEIQDLHRVTTDDEGNVYVTVLIKDIVVVVSDAGKHHRELLTQSDGLDKPWGIYFDKKENILLVCNDCDAFLFDVKKQ